MNDFRSRYIKYDNTGNSFVSVKKLERCCFCKESLVKDEDIYLNETDISIGDFQDWDNS
jgi:hypothetical protein